MDVLCGGLKTETTKVKGSLNMANVKRQASKQNILEVLQISRLQSRSALASLFQRNYLYYVCSKFLSWNGCNGWLFNNSLVINHRTDPNQNRVVILHVIMRAYKTSLVS